MKGKDGFILVFSLIRKGTMDLLNDFYESLTEVYDENVPPIILVGNKVDLDENHIAYVAPNDEDEDDRKGKNREAPKREITFDEAVAFGKKLGAVYYIETSAKTGYHVQSMIGKLVRHIVNKKYSEEQKKRSKSKGSSNKKWWTKCTVL